MMAAMQGEAFATLKYMAYADAARAHGDAQLAQLFENTAKVERDEHFAEHAKLYGLVGSDADNLRDAIKGENYETTEMYPEMAKRAGAAGDKEVAQHFREVGADEAKHRDAFKAALAKLTTK
jgi:rubrerythrin